MAGDSSASWANGVLFSDCITKDTPPPLTSPNTTFGYTPASRRGNRFEALEPLRQGVREHLGRFEAKAAEGLAIRHDHGSKYLSDDFQRELRFLGMASSPSFVREPEGNGCAERFIRTLKNVPTRPRALPTRCRG
jgi:transposase InsO family protein